MPRDSHTCGSWHLAKHTKDALAAALSGPCVTANQALRRRPKWTDKNVSLILYVVSFEKKIGFQITSFLVERQVVLVILKCNES